MIHSHGLWAPINHVAVKASRRLNIPYLISPRGMLSQWCRNQKAMRKSVAWWLYQRQDLQGMACAHATSHQEASDLRTHGWNGKTLVVPNGCDVEHDSGNRPQTSMSDRKKQVTFLSRINPVKGIPLLVDAWDRIRPVGWRCVIAGPGDPRYVTELQKSVSDRGLSDVIEFKPAVYGSDKFDLLNESRIFVLPSHSENFGMAIAESLSMSVPVITTTGTPWCDLEKFGCGWWVDRTIDAFACALRAATTSSPEMLTQMGQAGRELIRRKYAWKHVAHSMRDMYGETLGENVSPTEFSKYAQPKIRAEHSQCLGDNKRASRPQLSSKSQSELPPPGC